MSLPVPARVAIALLLLGLPTYATLWADEQGSPIDGWQRSVAVIVWLALAAVTAVSTAGHEDRVSELTDQQVDALEKRLSVAEGYLYDGLFSRKVTQGLPIQHWEYIVYGLQDDELRPIWFSKPPNGDTELYRFKVGAGATGLAFQDNKFTQKTGTAVSDDTHGLSQAQQQHFRTYQRVVAQPIYASRSDQIIGILGALSTTDNPQYDDAANQAAIRNAADVVGVVMERIGAVG